MRIHENPCDQTYRGPRVASEPEMTSSQKCILSIQDRVKLFICFHSYSQLLFIPWCYDAVNINDRADLDKLAKLWAAALDAVNGTKYNVGTPPELLCAGNNDRTYICNMGKQ